MRPRLQADDETVKIEIRVPATLKAKAERMAAADGDGDVSSWMRRIIRREWQRHDGDYDYLVEIKMGNFGLRDVAPRSSPSPRWEVFEIFDNQGPRLIASVDVDRHGQYSLPAQNRLLLEPVFSVLKRRHGLNALALRPR